jgi:hypothetical protein
MPHEHDDEHCVDCVHATPFTQYDGTTGMPNIVNFREKKLAKTILELRDQEGLVTYAYVEIPMTGKYRFLGESVGYPCRIPPSTRTPRRP